MDLDLGEKPLVNVKLGASTFKVDVPSVKQAQIFKDKMSGKEGDELSVFIELMVELGLPQDVCENLSVNQLTKLSEGLLGTTEKK